MSLLATLDVVTDATIEEGATIDKIVKWSAQRWD